MATTANALINTVKLVLMSTGIVFIAMLLTSQILNLTAAQLPAIWSSFRSWLRPPYLYVIINGIIITIAASSRLHHHYKHPHEVGGEDLRRVQHHDVDFRSSGEAYTYAEPKNPIVSVPETEASPLPTPVHEAPLSLAGFSFNLSYGTVLENHSVSEVVSYDEQPMFGATDIGIVHQTLSTEPEVVKDQRNFDLVSVEDGCLEPELVATRSVRKTPSPPPEPAPIARQETFEVVSSFFQSQLNKPQTQSRGSSRAILTSLDESATFGEKEINGRVKEEEKNRNYNIAPTASTPLARQETAEIVSSFFQSQVEKFPPSARDSLTSFRETANEVREEKVRSYNINPATSPPPPPAALARQETSEIVSSFFQSQMEKTTTFGHNTEIKEEKVQNYNIATGTSPSPLARQETSEIVSSFFQSQMEKPPPSARFGHHRRPSKTTPEGGKALRVAKSRKSDTLESTWKTITEGRHMPLTRHLKKSDTWENHNRQPDSSDPSTASIVKKSETFTDRTNISTAAVTARLKKDPSLSQDELNRRVEAFINKVNEEMRLQRQQSMQKFTEKVSR